MLVIAFILSQPFLEDSLDTELQ